MLAESENKMNTLTFGGCGFQIGSPACGGCCPLHQKRTKDLEVGSKVFEIPTSDGKIVWNFATVVSIDNDANTAVICCQCCDAKFQIDISRLEIARHGVFLIPDAAMVRIDVQ